MKVQDYQQKWKSLLTTTTFNIIEFSDVHVNHSVGHESIIEIMDHIIKNVELMKKTHRIIIAGDFYDHGLEYCNAEVVSDIEEFQLRLLQVCAKYDIQLRVLEGTKSHDRGQPIHFLKLNKRLKELTGLEADVQYFDKLCVVMDERYGDSTLYIPDQWNVDATKTYKEAVQAMHALGLTQVDMGVMHGSMKYQMPTHMQNKQDLHDQDLYNDLVKYILYMGHHHNASIYGKIHVAGSLQRFAFNEEEVKGYYVSSIHSSGNVITDFVPSHKTKPYVTVDVTGKVAEDVITIVDDLIDKHDAEIAIRLIAAPTDPAGELIKRYRLDYPYMLFRLKVEGQKETAQLPSIDLDVIKKNVTSGLTRNNIASFMVDRMKLRHPQFADQVEAVMKDVLDEIS